MAPAAEALLRRLTKQGELPSINALVDIGNLVSIRYGLPVAMFETRRPSSAARRSRSPTATSGSPTWARAPSRPPETGEVVFVDEAGQVSARRWCWRQSAESAASPATTEVLATVEGHHDAASADVAAALVEPRDPAADPTPRPPGTSPASSTASSRSFRRSWRSGHRPDTAKTPRSRPAAHHGLARSEPHRERSLETHRHA